MKSDTPEAIRKRKQRNRERAARTNVVTAPSRAAVADPQESAHAPTSSAPVTLHETVPVTGAGPDAYAAPPMLPPANDNDQPEPLAPPVDAAPKAPPTSEEVALFANGVAMYFGMGMVALVEEHGPILVKTFGADAINGAGERLPQMQLFVKGAAERVAIKYGLRIPYQDEVIVAGAIGIASFGLFGGKKNKKKNPAAAAKDANPPAPEPDDEPAAAAAPIHTGPVEDDT